MKANGYRMVLVALAALLIAAPAMAQTPVADSALFTLRVFDDCPFSTLTTGNMYPASIWIDDANLSCGGFANLHVWTLSDDGGMSEAVFNNDSWFRIAAELTISGTAEGEAGLRISPWWSQNVDGRLNVRTSDGEIACFGGRLPFFSFTNAYGLRYTKGDVIVIEMIYRAQALTASNPASIEYNLTYNGMSYSSGQLLFDEGNPAEPYGTWGMLDDGRVGGFVQPFLQAGNPDAQLRAEWHNIQYEVLQPIAIEETGWGRVKALFHE